MTDPTSDMLTRMRNALASGKEAVVVPYSKFKHNLAEVLAKEGLLKKIEVLDAGKQKTLSLVFQYQDNGLPAITGLLRVSKPGQRIYAGSSQIPKVKFGLGITIVSTSRGLLTDQQAKKEKVGGEVICQIW